MLALFIVFQYSNEQAKVTKTNKLQKNPKNFFIVVASLYDIHHNRGEPAQAGFFLF